MPTNEEIENESQPIKYIDELLWLLEDARRVAYGEADVSVLKGVIDEMSDGIPEWLESLKEIVEWEMSEMSKHEWSHLAHKEKPPHIEVWSDGELLISSGKKG